MIRTSPEINEIATALAKAQAAMENAAKNAANPHFKSRYADLAEVLNTVRPALAANGVCLIQGASYDAEHGLVVVDTMLAHSSGQWLAEAFSAPASKLDAQGLGSALTYVRRYSASAMVGLAQADDDGNAASGKGGRKADPVAEVGAPAVALAMDLMEAAGNGKAAFQSLWTARPGPARDSVKANTGLMSKFKRLCDKADAPPPAGPDVGDGGDDAGAALRQDAEEETL